MKKPTDYPIYLFNEGTNSECYKLMRPAYVVKNKKKVWRFRVWAPNAKSVSVVGNFNKWDRNLNPMVPIGGGIWETYIRGLKKYDIYKFSVEWQNGKIVMKADPYAMHTETPPSNASKLYDISGYQWGDDQWRENLKGTDHAKSAINIYELHLGSWKRHENGNYLSYRDMVDHLIPYVKEMGYTHVEFLPITEHPLEMSWGYQVSGFFAPTSRFGTPHDFMYLIDKLHQAGIGVILDLVLSHFPKDEFGLYNFDGVQEYEYSDPYKAEHKGWGTVVFDYGKGAVRSFLTSVACFWLENYHVDGLRLDAVASMIYLDYCRGEGEWKPNVFGGNYNLEAVDFLKQLNKTVLTKFPNAMMIAEESTSFPMVTMPPSMGGLGFNFKWNMGWMNDMLAYEKVDPFFRKGSHNKLTFGISYAFKENYVLPFSHDEVVHGKCSMVSKMHGNYEDKFRALKALYAFQYAHPGKKLNFMGNEIAQFIEWNYLRPIDWFLLEYDTHRDMQGYVRKLNHLYKENPAFYQLDNTYDGFKWLVVDDAVQNVVAFYREDEKGNRIIAIINFSDVWRKDYTFGVPDEGKYEVIMNSNAKDFIGGDVYSTQAVPMHGHEQSLKIMLEGNSALYLKLIKEE